MTVEWTELARRDLRRLHPDVARRVIQAVDRLAVTRQGNIRKLTDSGNSWRLRVGDWRVRFFQEPDTIIVERVLHRREVYRR